MSAQFVAAFDGSGRPQFVGLFSPPAQGIVIRDDYERSSVNVAGSSVSGVGDDAIVAIKPRLQESEVVSSGTRWLEPSARVDNVNETRPTFTFIDYGSGEGKYHGFAWGSRKPMFSYDRETWHYFDNCTVNADNIEFRHNTAFTGNTVYIGRGRQMSVTQVGQWLDALSAQYPSMLAPTPSALAHTPALTGWPGQEFIAAEFSAQTNELGATIPPTPFYAAQIGAGSTLAILSAGVHAGEDHSDWVYRATVEYLCGASAEAATLRQRYTILLYPMVNAPGRAGGGWRGSFTQGKLGWDDLNRHFSTTDSNLEIIDIPKAAMLTDLDGKTPSWAIDFHAAYTSHQVMYQGDEVEEAFRLLLYTYTGYTFGNIGSFTADALGRWYRTGIGATLATILEFCAPTPVTDARIVQYGSGIVGALARMSDDKDIPWEWIEATSPATVTASASVGMGGVKQAVAPLNIVGSISVEASGIKSTSGPATFTAAAEYGASGIKTIAGLDKEGPAVITASATVGMGGVKGGVGAAVLGADYAPTAGWMKGVAGQAWFAAMGEFYASRGPDEVPITADEIGRAVSLQARNYSAVLAKRNYTARL
jgi:hypothetical protein